MSAKEFFTCNEIRESIATDNCYLHTFSDSQDSSASPRQRREMLKMVVDRLASLDEIALTDGMVTSAERLKRVLDFTSSAIIKKENVTDDIHSRQVDVEDAKVIKSELMQVLEPLTDFDYEIYDFAQKWVRERSMTAPNGMQLSCEPSLKPETKLDLGPIKTIAGLAVVSMAAWGGFAINDDLALGGVDAPDRTSFSAFATGAG